MKDKHRQKAEEELKQHWIIIASLAWKGYQNLGRGFLLINELPPERMRYFSLKEGLPPTLGGSRELKDCVQDTEHWVQIYVPEKEIVVAVWLDKMGGLYNFHLIWEPYPPEAYAMRRHQLEKN